MLRSFSMFAKCYLCYSFFLQAEDGIRDGRVTGVQTCALPICYRTEDDAVRLANDTYFGLSAAVIAGTAEEARRIAEQIGRVSCRERVLKWICALTIKVF